MNKDTYYKWKRKFNGIEINDVKRLRELERDNAKKKEGQSPISIL
ncbi:MAG: hypothetical protein JJV94_00990 [Sulfurospirillum sp.]|nr:hypothetical protein [Sulfurospirillum sp.]